ncbi:hypothetical protein L6452_23536 [Arctium lappa]|uniref:Uncharacterized protein n=1 Tax=Arctium lappa TaxID=4217 RepID=A0ACB9B3X5_ARCLA|nr:hypothetical protein L6452_23536 [Arctium lappa]
MYPTTTTLCSQFRIQNFIVRVYLAKQALPLCSREIGKGEKMTWPTDGLNFSSASSAVSSDDVSSDEANGRGLHMVASDVAYSDHKMSSR